ncbi:MAG: type II toxin-antitoxin system PemK/MazF family toxin [Pirellulales bacterium]
MRTCACTKTRPAVIVQADHLGTGLPQVVVAMITSRMFRAGHPSRVAVLKNSADGCDSGLLSDSVVMTDNLATKSETAIDRVIGRVARDAIDVALRLTLALGRRALGASHAAWNLAQDEHLQAPSVTCGRFGTLSL